MKERIKKFAVKNKKYLIILAIGFLFILSGYISWNIYFSKIEIFKNEEKELVNAAKRYYSFRKQYLPKEGEYRQIDLQTLYENVEMDDLYVPKTKKACSLDSWVKVYMKDGEYNYVAYLECGKYKSKIDHEGPKVTLNGNKTFYVALNSKYEELGVKEVIDNKDGKLDVNKVVIDSSKVDTTKIGEYEVTYSIKDSNYNETVVTRKIVVSKGLTDTMKPYLNSEGYYQGTNNYVLFSGMLWRVVRVNENGTVKIILDQPSSNLRVNYDKYENSNIDTWLNEYFYKALTNADKYVVDTDFCVGNINSLIDYSTYCSEKVTRKVGLLDINEYYKTTSDGITYSIQSKNFMLGHKIGDDYALVNYTNFKTDGTTNTILAPIRPVITLTNTMNIISGTGSKEKPYKLGDYEYAEKGTKLKDRIIGEYFIYSGIKFRVIGKDDDKNVVSIMANGWTVQPDNTPLRITYTKLDNMKFNIGDEDNPGYIINNDYLDYINAKNIVKMDYDIPVNDPEKKYNEYKKTNVKAKVLLPKTYELFAAATETDQMYTYIDQSINEKNLFAANSDTSQVFQLDNEYFDSYGIKAVMTLKGDLRIESGKGTITNPYRVK